MRLFHNGDVNAYGVLYASKAAGGGFVINNPTADGSVVGQSYITLQTATAARWYFGMSAAANDGAFSIYNGISGFSNLSIHKTTGLTSLLKGLDVTGNISYNAGTATARLHLPAGTASASTAPAKLTAGTLLTTPELGAIEFTDDGTTAHFYVTTRVATVVTRVQVA
jgi:hypothetical protein